ncbi:hypothetical protein AGMMS49938_03600 [Fibrobacterales bacterium]|nr:hypothetical protein AGMMS49938_03600 [Fibrobacterales bacterium]
MKKDFIGNEEIPKWKLERYLLGELPRTELLRIRELEQAGGTEGLGSNELQNELAALRADNAKLLEEYPSGVVVEKMLKIEVQNKTFKNSFNPTISSKPEFLTNDEQASEKIIPFKKSRVMPVMSAAAALVISLGAVSVYLLGEPSINNGGFANANALEETTRTKGMKPALEVWRKTADSAEKLSNGNFAKEGDILQLRYNVPEKCYGALLSLDGNGTLTIHLSGTAGKSVPLEAGIASLEKSYQLDNAPKFEKFYLLTSTKEFLLAPVAENLLHGKPPSNLQVAEVDLRK